MFPIQRPVLPAVTVTAVMLGLVLSAPVGSAKQSEAPAPGPQLSIAIDNGKTSVARGDKLDYTVTLRNLGTSEIRGLRVTQTIPTGLKVESADSGGEVRLDGIDWKVDLKASAQIVFRSAATVMETPADLLRLASVACAAMSEENSPPIVCASHSARLPAGAAAEEARAQAEGAGTSTGFPWWYPVGGVLLVGAAIAVWLVRRRRGAHEAD